MANIKDNIAAFRASMDYISNHDGLQPERKRLMPRTIEFNTGRKYTAEGQFIKATLHADGVVTFFDHSRSIDGEFKLCGSRFDQSVVLDAYDNNIAKGTQRSWSDGMLRDGCNARKIEIGDQPHGT